MIVSIVVALALPLLTPTGSVHSLSHALALPLLTPTGVGALPRSCGDCLITEQWCEQLVGRCKEPRVAKPHVWHLRHLHLHCFCLHLSASASASPSAFASSPTRPEPTLGTPTASYIPEVAPILHLQPHLNGAWQQLSMVLWWRLGRLASEPGL